MKSRADLLTVGPDPAAGDRRLLAPRALTTPCGLAPLADLADWRRRAAHIRERILSVTGLLPSPRRSPLRARVFGRVEEQGCSVEKVHFESLPGLFVCGNLYRPLGLTGAAPGIACPHGHWSQGRFHQDHLGSVPGRGIGLARLGCVAFAYDMVGYNDSAQFEHRLAFGPRAGPWGVGQLGLQLWNSLRVIDFLCSLSDVDPRRIGVTGASGGGTQTFLLTAVDDRVAAAAPVNMISGHMQGGCVCENQAHLRLDLNNIEIAACAAPRPLMMVSATGDWTVHTPYHEYPAVRRVYDLFGAAGRVHTCQVEADHNYNRASREAVYGFFRRYLLGGSGAPVREPDLDPVDPAELHVFPREPGSGRTVMPKRALAAGDLIDSVERRARRRNALLQPRDLAGLRRLRSRLGPALRHCLAARMPAPGEVDLQDRGRERLRHRGGELVYERLLLRLEGGAVPAVMVSAASAARGPAALVVHGEGKAALFTNGGKPRAPVAALLRAGHRVLTVDPFLLGEAGAGDHPYPVEGIDHFHTYNPVTPSARVQDVLTALGYLRDRPETTGVCLLGLGRAGLWCLFAAAAAGPDGPRATCVEVGGFHFERDWESSCPIPAVRAAGDVTTAAALIAPGRLAVHGASAGQRFPAAAVRRIYRSAARPEALTISRRRWSSERQVGWLLT